MTTEDTLHYDQWQFERFRHNRPVSSETRIDWSDYGRMGCENGEVPLRHARWIPPFAAYNEKLKAVILEQERMHTLYGNRQKNQFGDKCARAVKHAGGYRAMLAGIGFRAWRLRQDAINIADQMEMSPVVVRQYLYRMICVARQLGFETCPPGPSRWKRKPRTERKPKCLNWQPTTICVDCEERPTAPGLRRLCRKCRNIRLADRARYKPRKTA